MRDAYRRKIIIFLFIPAAAVCFISAAGDKYSFSRDERDPFSPLINRSGAILITEDISIKNLSLKGIIYSQGAPLAVINDEIFKEGDSVGEYRILSIKEREVVLKKGEDIFILKLEE